MGWFWQSPPRSPAEGKPAPAPASDTPKPTKARDDSVDPEISKFLELFQTELKGGKEGGGGGGAAPPPAAPATTSDATKPSSASAPASSSGSSSWLSWGSGSSSSSSQVQAPSSSTTTTSSSLQTAAAADPPPGPSMADTIDPAPTSCRQAFDYAFHCNGVGGQWNAIYRYGGVRDCSEKWDDFWFCMRVKAYPPDARLAAYRERERARELERYGPGRPSSEDVWRSRDRKVEPGTAFVTPIPRGPEDDLEAVEWNERHMEARRKIREGLGFYDGGGAGDQGRPAGAA